MVLCPGQEAELPAGTACTHLALAQKGVAWGGPEKTGKGGKLHTHTEQKSERVAYCVSLP
mgnify:CR=1 FL=1